MTKLREHIVREISIAVLIIALLTPSVVKLVDAFQTHSYEICKTPQTHFHKQVLNCDLCKIKFNHALDFQFQEYSTIKTVEIVQCINFYKPTLSNLKLEQTSLRGPPQLI